MISTILIIVFVVFALWFWYTSSLIHQLAKQAAQELCAQQQWQLLDDSVALKKVGIARAHDGRMRFIRHYQFEYALPSGERFVKRIIMHGKQPGHKGSKDDNVIQFPNIKG